MQRIALDIECNRLKNPDKIWVIACQDLDTGEQHVYRNVTENVEQRTAFSRYYLRSDLVVGHNALGYDILCLYDLIPGLDVNGIDKVRDTLIISRMYDYGHEGGHSIEAYGQEFGTLKGEFSDFSRYSEEMVEYCKQDASICASIYKKFKDRIEDATQQQSIRLEHQFQYYIVNKLEANGFAFNRGKAEKLRGKVEEQLASLDQAILEAFPPRLKQTREVKPRITKYETLNRNDFRWLPSGSDLSDFNGGDFCLCHWAEFNPNSHKQIVEVLNEAKWKPVDKTKTHVELDRKIKKLEKRKKYNPSSLDEELQECYNTLDDLRIYGWKVNENNLATLPARAPGPAKTLARRILYEARRRSLVEWLSLVGDDDRIHGRFQGIGAWTMRMSHQKPNTANIPTLYNLDKTPKLLGSEMRSLWIAPKNRLLLGVDAEGIQLRIFAHYINDQEFTDALVRGRKEDKTDPHSLNQRVLGSVCKSREAAKRYIYALLLGAGMGKLREILDCSEIEAKTAYDRLLEHYPGFARLKASIIPKDAEAGYFCGLDGHRIIIPGSSVGTREHLAMSGYLQAGEAKVMKLASLKFISKLPEYDGLLVNFVHDEWQIELENDVMRAIELGKLVSQCLKEAGEDLGLRCPLAGSFWNDGAKDYTIGTNWKVTH